MEEVRNWLRGLGLEQYAQKFEEEGWDTLEILQHMAPDDVQGVINKPGHRKKFEIGLKSRPSPEKNPETLGNDDRTPEPDTNVEQDLQLRMSYMKTPEASESDEERATQINETKSLQSKTDGKTQNVSFIKGGDRTKLDNGHKELFNELGGQTRKHNDHETDNTYTSGHPVGQNEVESESQEIKSEIQSISKYSVTTVDSKADYLKDREVSSRIDRIGQDFGTVMETVCVKGARNKIVKTKPSMSSKALLSSHKELVPRSKRIVCQGAMSHGFMAVKDRIERSNRNVLEESIDDSSSDSNDEESTALVNVEDTGLENKLMISNSGRSVKQATIVKDSKNVTIARKAEVYHVHTPENKEQGYNFKDQIWNVVQSYKRKDHLFVETKAFHEVEDIINDRAWAVIIGKPGDGKTTMAAHLLLKYQEKGFEAIIATNAQDWKALVRGSSEDNPRDKQFVMIDDMFGSMSVDDKKVNEWISILDIMHRLVKERNGSLVVVMTSRSYVFNDVKSRIEKFPCFLTTSFVDLTQAKHVLNVDEKLQIWHNYTKEYNVTSEQPLCVYTSVIMPHGFPHCVDLYCSNKVLRQVGVAFFENPMEYVCKEIQNFKDNDKIKFCLLLLILFNRNKLEESYLQKICLSDPPKEVVKIFKAAGLSSDHAQSELKKALKSLKNTYVYETLDNTYCFSHESIRENVAYIYIKENPLHAIEDMDFTYLVQHTKCNGFKTDKQKSVFPLPLFCYSALVERTLKEIKNGQTMLVCQHQAWDDPFFVSKWLGYVLQPHSQGSEVDTIFPSIFVTSINPLTNGSIHVNFNFIEALIFCNRTQAVNHLLDNAVVINKMRTDELRNTVSRVLICACFLLPSKDFIIKLLNAGADVNFTMSVEEIMRYTIASMPLFRPYSISLVYNPLLCSVVTKNQTLVRLFLSHDGSPFIAEEPVALIAAVQLSLPDIVEQILDAELISKKRPFTLEIWNCRFIRYNLVLNTECLLSLVHLANDIDTLDILIQRGVRVDEDVLVQGSRMPHCIYRIITGWEIKTFGALLQAGMKVTETWMGRTFLSYLLLHLSDWKYKITGGFCLPMCLLGPRVTEYCELLSTMVMKSSPTNINQTDINGNCALHYFFQTDDHSDVLQDIYRTLFGKLIRCGADVNMQGYKGTTPAMLALANCTDMNTIKTCVEQRKKNMLDSSGRGYFHYLAKSKLQQPSLIKVVKTLLHDGEDINLPDRDGFTPIFACSHDSLMSFYSTGARIDAVNNFGQNIMFGIMGRGIHEESFQVLEKAIDIVPKPNTCDISGQTLMHCLMSSSVDAISRFQLLFDRMLSMGFDPEKSDKNGVTPLMLAAENPSLNVSAFTVFIKLNLELARVDSCSLSILHHLLKSNRDNFDKLTLLRLLLSHTPDLFSAGRNVLMFAFTETYCGYDIIEELLKYKTSDASDDERFVIGLLLSNRDLYAKQHILTFLIASSRMQISIRDILLSNVLPRRIKASIMCFLPFMLNKPTDIILKNDEIHEVLKLLDDNSALTLLKQMADCPALKYGLSDKKLCMTLCEESHTKSLKFLIKLGIYLKLDESERAILLNAIVSRIIVDEELVDILTMLLERDIDILKPDQNKTSVLHVACGTKPLKPMSTCILMDKMETIDQLDSDRMTALHYLCTNNANRTAVVLHKFDATLYLAFCLICKGADVDNQNLTGQTAIMTAINAKPLNEDLLTLLIENSKSINRQDANGNTALHHLARTSARDDFKSSIMKLIIQKGADVTMTNNDGQTCLSILQNQINHGQVGLYVFAEFMTETFLGNERDVLDIIFTHLALRGENHESLEKLKYIIMKRKIDVNTRLCIDACTMMMVACENLLPDTNRVLVSLKADPNMRDMIGCTCLTRFLYSRQIKYMSVLYCCYVGGDIHKESCLQLTSLFWNTIDTPQFLQVVADAEVRYSVGSAICCKEAEGVNNKALDALKTVLLHGGNPNLPDICGKTPLHHFVQSPLSDLFICPAIQMLIGYGADVNIKDYEGMTPLMACSQFAGYKARRLKILMEAGANIKDIDSFGCDVIDYGKMAFGIKWKINQKKKFDSM